MNDIKCVVCDLELTLNNCLIDDIGITCQECSDIRHAFTIWGTPPLSVLEIRNIRNKTSTKHVHKPKKYIGFTDTYMYCEECQEKL